MFRNPDPDQLRLDMRLESERSIEENVDTSVEFTRRQIMNGSRPPTGVRNRHEAYGIAADNYAKVSGTLKAVKGDMGTLLTTLGDPNLPALEAVSSLCNSALSAAIATITMTAEMRRTLSDLYETENLSTDEPMEGFADDPADGFEDAAPLDGIEFDDNETEDD